MPTGPSSRTSSLTRIACPTSALIRPSGLHTFSAKSATSSGGFKIAVENLNYTAARLMEVWPSRFRTLAIARQYERNPQKLGNFVYANRMGNGNAASGDGYRFRGRGLLQLTGRNMYRAVKKSTGLELEDHPEIAEQAPHALVIAGGAWKFDRVDQLSENASVEEYTQRINGGQTGITDRRRRFAKVKQIMGL